MSKKPQTMTINTKTINKKKKKIISKQKTIKPSKVFDINNAQGTITFTKIGGNKNITISNNGKITIKKKTPKGTYRIQVNITTSGNDQYNSGTKLAVVTIKIK